MKILLTMNLPYYPAHGGANKSNKYLLEALAGRGHEVRAVAPALGTPARLTHAQLLDGLVAKGLDVAARDDVYTYNESGVGVHSVISPSKLRARLVEQIEGFKPDWVIVSTEDPSQNLLDAAIKAAPGRVIYLVHTLSFLPFGPMAFFPSRSRAELLTRVAAIVGVGKFVARYIREWGGYEAKAIYLPVYGEGPFSRLGDFNNRFVTLINPCAVKGITIFKELARDFPGIEFAAVASWGTTNEDRAELEGLPNVRLLDPTDDVDRVFAQTRVLLAPSLLAEAFGMVVVEAMLRGIPVLASDVGGLPEAKLGVDYVLPVRQAERFGEDLDTNMIPAPEIPEQDVGPWRQALSKLTSDRRLYEEISESSRAAALRFVSSLTVAPLEQMMSDLSVRAAPRAHPAAEGGAGKASGSPAAEASPKATLADLTPEQRALLIMRLRKKSSGRSDKAAGNLRIGPAPRDIDLPLSFAQHRLWFLDQVNSGADAYNIPAGLRIRGSLNVRVMNQAIDEVVARHDSLRTTFISKGGRPVQQVSPPAPMAIPLIDLSEAQADWREVEAARLGREEAKRPFDLAAGPLLRVMLIRMGDGDYALLLTAHHIISDGWSMGVFVREMVSLYEAFSEGRQSPLTKLEIQYGDFAYWQRQYLQGETLQKLLSFWKEQLAGAPSVLQLKTDRQRPAVQTLAGANRPFVLSTRLFDGLNALSNHEGVTLFVTLLAGFNALLNYYSDQEEIIVGSNIASRNREELEPLIGFFVNMLPLRTSVAGDPAFRELTRRVRDTAFSAYAHQDLPFNKLVEEIQPDRDMSRMPLVQVVFNYQSAPAERSTVRGLTLSPFDTGNEAAKFDLTLDVVSADRRLWGGLIYNTDLFYKSTINSMVENYEAILSHAVSNPEIRLSELRGILAAADEQRREEREKEIKVAQRRSFRSIKPKPISGSKPEIETTP